MANQTSAQNVRAGGAYVELSATDVKLQRGLDKAQNRLRKFSSDVGAMGAALTKIGGGIVAPLALATNQYASFSDKMLVVRARTKASDEEFAAMKNRVQELTRTTSFSATEIAEGMINLASMGMNPTQINGMIESLLNLSRATGEELGNAVTIALNNMNIFKADIKETDNYVDILSKTANGSAQILGDLGEALKMSANSAKIANVDFLSLNAILAVLANNGQRGTMAGTGLRNIFLSFTKNADKFKEYGISIKDASGELRAIPDIFDDIAKKVKVMPTFEKQQMFSDLFGTRGINSAAVLAENTNALRQFMNELKNASGDTKTVNPIVQAFSKNIDIFKKYGIAVKNSNDELRNIPDIFDDISKKTDEMSDMGKQQMFSDLFGVDNAKLASSLAGNKQALQQFLIDLQNKEGDAKKTAQLMDSEIGGALRKAGNSFKGLTAEIGKAIAEYITPLVSKTAQAINTITDWVKRNHDLIVSVAKIGAACIAAGVALLALSKVFVGASMAIGALKLAIHGAIAALMLLTNPLYAAIALAGTFAFAMTDAADEFKKGFSAAFDDVKSGYDNLTFAILNGKLEDAFAIVVLSIKSIWHDLFDEIISYWKAIESFFAKGFAWIYSKFDKSLNFDEMSKSIDDMISNDVVEFKTARQKYQKEINDIVNGIKTAKAERNEKEAERGGRLGISNDLLDSLKKLPSVELDMKDKVNKDATFGSFSLDAINLGAPTFEVNKQMLKKLEQIEKNTRSDDDDEAVTVW